MLSPVEINDYLNNPGVPTDLISLTCKVQTQKYIDTWVNDSNLNFVAAVWSLPFTPMPRFKNPKWMTDDRWVFDSVFVDYRKLVEYSNTNILHVSNLMRMMYFTEYVKYNGSPGVQYFNDLYFPGGGRYNKKTNI
jgi:hypothetical protein